MKFYKIFLIIALIISSAYSLEFSLIKKENNTSEPTLLVIGGIQGDEPGGFNASTILATHYTITKGNVWVVPNLNFYSIVKRSRGPYGDMNRKFAALKESDPEYNIVQRIKSIITDKQVDLVVNMHDGSGYYRHKYIDKLHNPNRWGQCSIIDQEVLDIDSPYKNLLEISQYVVNHVNENLLDEEHRYHTHNTRTRDGDVEMEKTLTYFAINNAKPAFGNEATKDFNTPYRVYYHLLALEAYMKYMGIEFTRNFDLTPKDIASVINSDYEVTLFEKITLPTKDIRKRLRYIPTDKDKILYSSQNPLICAIKDGSSYKIHYGNRKIASLSPQFFHYDDSLDKLEISVDGKVEKVSPGSTICVDKYFKILSQDGYRINIIGYSNAKKIETDIKIYHKNIPKRFSIDKKGKIYRIEVYKGEKFSGMFLVKFR
jgi:hypothetical protein